MGKKLKREDDYRNKRISSTERFQDKIHQKESAAHSRPVLFTDSGYQAKHFQRAAIV